MLPVATDNNAASPRTAVDFAVPFSPRMSAPPISGRTAHNNREPQPIVPDDRAERIRLHGRST
ncbi:Uncharacterised protein [Mycobacterium tuberculosis]|uniref:Uncharacterized protein n=1 Tax=Mycobacterium tuberculosis TaxID=1773 RepID=A0A655AC06_MYCTX|nr:Uncharacterised protein [Mycobacterium tuberculosis]CFE52680.1 Uncharacterised protein [Mycobacterium tuberculosis]CFR97695.1 Uncharacterised protein [Mycobacterium tuberculosis]CFV45455.1 Uncharacterised protein [Mycobacterium tuberculosis]CKN24111.1 Uncharacterised protein [Mycobacterium tuberculosis]